MRVKHYIVTYNNSIVATCARTILDAILPKGVTREVTIINNHSAFELPEDLYRRVHVLHNMTRPDFSTGHLARNWNEAILHGFRSLVSPDADIVVASQNDCQFAPDYLQRLLDLHRNLDLITHGDGDNCVSYTARGVRRVGLWDERFCNIGYQEADYFLRAVKYLDERCSINDVQHHRIFNARAVVTLPTVTGYSRGDESHRTSLAHHPQSRYVFSTKWTMLSPDMWGPGNMPQEAHQKIGNIILYPYFERDIETLLEQQYLVV